MSQFEGLTNLAKSYINYIALKNKTSKNQKLKKVLTPIQFCDKLQNWCPGWATINEALRKIKKTFESRAEPERLATTPKKPLGFLYIYSEQESLILAQSERWRRA